MLKDALLVSEWILSASAPHFLYTGYFLSQSVEFHQTCMVISLRQA